MTASARVLHKHSILSEFCLRSVGYDVRSLRKDKLNKNYNTMINDEKSIIRSVTDCLRDYKVKDHGKTKATKIVSRSTKKQGSTSTLCLSTTSESEACAATTPKTLKPKPKPQGTPKSEPKNPRHKTSWYNDDNKNERPHTDIEDD